MIKCGAVAEWSKALAWKVSMGQKPIEGSNPSRSATLMSEGVPRCPAQVRRRPAFSAILSGRLACVERLVEPTCTALHLWSQVIGKYRLAQTPWINHSWHATLYVHPRGLTTGPVPDGDNLITLTMYLLDHALITESSNG